MADNVCPATEFEGGVIQAAFARLEELFSGEDPGYPTKPLKEVARIVMGQSPPSSSYNENRQGIPFLQGKAEFGLTHPHPRLYCTEPNKLARTGSVLLSVRAPVGAVNTADQGYCIGRGLCSLENLTGPNSFLLYAMIHGEARLNKLATGTTFVAVTKGAVESFQIPFPDPGTQHGIVRTLEAIQAARLARLKEIELERERKAALMAHLFAYGTQNEPRRDTPLGPLPESWEVVRFDTDYMSQLGKMLSAKARGGEKPSPYLRNANVQWGRVVIDDLLRMDFDDREKAKFNLTEGDLLICEGGEIGRTAMWRGELSDCYFQKAIHRVRPKSADVVPEFLLHFMDYAFRQIKLYSASGTTTTIAHLPKEKLCALLIPRPSKSEQEVIARALSASDEAIAALEAEAKLLDELFRATLEELMSGRLSVTPLFVEGAYAR